MTNLGQMLKQAQAMQAKMDELRAEVERIEVTGASGGGLVSVTLSGKGAMRAVKIAPSLAQPGEIEVLEDLVLAAYNDARGKLDERLGAEMAKITGGLQLPPGLRLPF